MKALRITLPAGENRIAAIMAGELLRQQAEQRGEQVMIDHAIAGEASDILIARPGEATRAVSPEAALADPAACLPPASPRPAIVAVTSCPTGIAHTFMAAEGLREAAAALGYPLEVETQGSVGAGTPLSEQAIATAEIVLIAADREVDRSRFGGKRVFVTNARSAITEAPALIERALAEATPQAMGPSSASATSAKGTGPYRHLMNGVSFVLPFVVAGGLIIALAFALAGLTGQTGTVAPDGGTLAGTLMLIGAKAGFGLIVPVLSGYIAFSIADRPGLAPGMIGGAIAATLGAGFLGGIATGFLAGYVVAAARRAIPLPAGLEGLRAILILPLVGTLATGLLTWYLVGTPVAALLGVLTEWLRSLQGAHAMVLGLVLGAMMAVDMGGPVNKASYAFSIGLVASGVTGPMAATMLGGMTPPLALALACRIFPDRFTAEELQAGKAAAVLGLAFITEGAIPFAARDPLRVIPAVMAGSGVAGALAMGLGVASRVPHGGIFVLPIPGAIVHPAAFIIALVAGSLVGTGALALTKRPADLSGPEQS